ncbi:DNA polymerase III subunit alpha [Pseudaquabacterium pictum]|uniref:DNA polymerase III subunit alpha n=1 Tax=Pseudaquabacterium pictum TaxID=2315236 RepID=A0A480AV29_9BURK|nr:DNA polymerase III subunit alpha [Rubrivivax pictus]GCL62628.1 DNA-directed DNA polymerase [Rubrivivax pictus]
MPFVHLRTHSEYSVVDGTLRVDDAAAAAKADGQPALAITDLSNLFGAVKFYKACRGKGVKPIIGADIFVEPEQAIPGSTPVASRLLLLVQNRQGYLNLCELLARGWVQNAQRAQAWITWDWLAELGGGLIALSGADLGAVGQALLAGDTERARAVAQRLSSLFPGRFYIELQRAGLATHEPHVRAAVPLAAALGLPVVATHPIEFAEPDDFDAHEARVCVAEGETLANPKRVKRFGREQYFKTQAQMEALFADVPSAVANTLAIAQRCNLTLAMGKNYLPDFPTPLLDDGTPMPMGDYFRQASFEGLEQRLLQLFPDAAKRDAERPRYVERLEFEITTILKMGFPGYFLIVADFINWAKNNGCPVGPGRGSGAGSLVAYALKITDLDPLHYKLLFERFLNPERVSMPDFDIDFCQGNRDRVIDYVKDKYGRAAVSQIATFGTMAAKAALRDIGRVLGMGYGHVDSVAKLIPAPPGKTVTLAKVPENPDPGLIYARKEAPELEQREAAEEEVAELLSLATRVEGIVRNIGMHAGGVLIAPGKITDFCPLYQQPGSDSAVSQYDKDDVEAIGLVKFDFLGLATLTILELAKDFIVARNPDKKDFSFDNIPLDDPRVYKLFSDGLTESVFQFESRGMQGMLRDAKPSRLEDLIALNALYRPGPMDLIPSFVARKHGKEVVEYPHPLLEQVLSETYGIMVYQEQVMQSAQILGGYSLGGADLLRRAMGKKKAEEMAKHREIFREGAGKQGIGQEKADEVFDLMEKFAGYGFNKSHAAAYSLLAYHTAWLKVHHTAEFYAANMTIEMDDTDKLKVLLNDAKLFGISFSSPDVNEGTYRFEPLEKKRVRYALGAVKGTGQSAVEAIVEAREAGGRFHSFFDFCARVDRKRVNKRAVEALVKAGAFDALHADRASLVASIGLGFEFAEHQVVNASQGGLFDDGDHGSSTQEPPLIPAAPWSIKERLLFEKTAVGFFLSGHLFQQSETEVRRFCKRRIGDLVDSRDPQLLAGIVSDLRFVNGQRGRVAIFKLDDQSEAIEAVANDELIEANKALFVEDELLIVQGKVQPDRFSGGLRLNVNAVWDLAAARARFGRYLALAMNGGGVAPLADLVNTWPAKRETGDDGLQRVLGLPLRLQIARRTAGASAQAELDLGEDGRFWPSDEALARCKALAHGGRAEIVYEAS